MAAAKAAAPPPSNSQYPFYIHPKIIINFDFVEYDKRGRRVWVWGEPVEIVEYNLLHLISYSPSAPSLSLSVFQSHSVRLLFFTQRSLKFKIWDGVIEIVCGTRDRHSARGESNEKFERNRIRTQKARGNLWIISLERIRCGQLPKNTHTSKIISIVTYHWAQR